jgi:NitT/TauT family transport system permease protein
LLDNPNMTSSASFGSIRLRSARPLATSALGLIALVAAWAALAARVDNPNLLPGPAAVGASFLANGPRIGWHAGVTLVEVLLGFAIGFSAGLVMGYVISRSTTLEELMSPLLVGSQAVPVVAIAPLLVYAFGGTGLEVKVAVAAIIVFFPVLVTTIVALRSIDAAYGQLMRVLSADSWQTLRWVEAPAALPALFGAARVGVTLAVIGAVVGEFLGADRGLGSLIQVSRGQFNDNLNYAALVALAALALGLYSFVVIVERYILRHRAPSGVEVPA